jgi:hypothetical protein
VTGKLTVRAVTSCLGFRDIAVSGTGCVMLSGPF